MAKPHRSNSAGATVGKAGDTPGVRGLLLLQEWDLGLDRSYRTQPHWLFTEDGPPAFRTYVLQNHALARLPHDAEQLASQGVFAIEATLAGTLRALRSGHRSYGALGRDAFVCAVSSLFASRTSSEGTGLWLTARLLARAYVLAVLCERLNISTFLTGDNWLPEADAMQIIAPRIGIKTLSYQYSNLLTAHSIMMTTADIMITFSPEFDSLWMRGDIRPVSIVSNGYIFDSSFEHVRERSCAHREKLVAAGAEFVLCYFDETVAEDKYGIPGVDEHCAEVIALVRLLLEDPTVGLIVKTQYERNSPLSLCGGYPGLEAARDTGRYVELRQGAHRNTVFPAEAALVSDMAIGHASGSSAGLEAALAGRRCILLNPWGVQGVNARLYAECNIRYRSVGDAIAAVRRFRAGDPSEADLGDWSSIVHHFDPYRDGKAGHRMRRILEGLVCEGQLGSAELGT